MMCVRRHDNACGVDFSEQFPVITEGPGPELDGRIFRLFLMNVAYAEKFNIRQFRIDGRMADTEFSEADHGDFKCFSHKQLL